MISNETKILLDSMKNINGWKVVDVFPTGVSPYRDIVVIYQKSNLLYRGVNYTLSQTTTEDLLHEIRVYLGLLSKTNSLVTRFSKHFKNVRVDK